ncbi:MAG: glycosyltransferase family 39 protein [Candidatus Kapabacteria bacterium]|nr:glycosyltransferase family 39 protein [Candidatus Kapabacteria bacterium]
MKNKLSKKHIVNPKTKALGLGKLENFFESNSFIYMFMGAVILLILIARLHLLSVPFERDEGEYAYMGTLILDGHSPYTFAYNMKYPGTYLMYAIMMGIFGKTVESIHLGLMLISIASLILVYFISTKFLSKSSSAIAASTFGILATSWTMLGQAAHATNFVIFFALFGILILQKSYQNVNGSILWLFLSGMMFSLAYISKQSGLFFLIFALSFIVIKDYKVLSSLAIIKRLLLILLGFAIPVILMFLYFYIFGDFEKFWFWTVTYLSKYGSQMNLSRGYDNFLLSIRIITGNYTSEGYVIFWFIGLLGLGLLYFMKMDYRKKLIIASFVLMSFLTVVPGYYFRNHYYITFLPALAILIGVFFEYFKNIYRDKLKFPLLTSVNILFFVILISVSLSANSQYLFSRDNNITCKMIYGENPFVESFEIAEYLKANTSHKDKIAIIGSEPQIYFYADRYSATGYIYTYNLVELHDYALIMQKEMIREIEANEPKYIVFVNARISWLIQENSERYIFKWSEDYIKNNYLLVGSMDISPKQIGRLITGENLKNFKSHTGQTVSIYQRL